MYRFELTYTPTVGFTPMLDCAPNISGGPMIDYNRSLVALDEILSARA